MAQNRQDMGSGPVSDILAATVTALSLIHI